MADVAEILKARIAGGILFYLGARLNKEVTERFLRKQLGEYGELHGTGVAMALDAFDLKRRLGEYDEYVEYVVDAISDYGVMKSLEAKLEKTPICYFKDTNTVVAKNLEPSALAATAFTVYVDGVQQTIAGVTGSVESAEIALSAPVTAGKHTLTVVSDKGIACTNKNAYA